MSMRHTYEVLPPQRVQAAGLSYPHQVQVALPPSFRHGEPQRYPALWVTDASLLFDLTVGILNGRALMMEAPDLVVIGVGAPSDLAVAEFNRRRAHDFYAEPKWVNGGPGGERMESSVPEEFRRIGGGAGAFLSFLVDDLRPRLTEQHRLADDHGVVGISAGGHFVGYSLLARPGVFTRHLAVSPAFSGCGDLLFRLEEAHAAQQDDLPAKVFLAFGGNEATDDPYIAASDVAASTVRMAQTLTMRGYPSLELTMRVVPDQGHASVAPHAVADGLRVLYPRAVPTPDQPAEAVDAAPDAST